MDPGFVPRSLVLSMSLCRTLKSDWILVLNPHLDLLDGSDLDGGAHSNESLHPRAVQMTLSIYQKSDSPNGAMRAI
jgi:hypothetical protein